MTTKHQASRLEIYVAWKHHHQQQKYVTRVFPVLGHSYNAAWIQRLEEFGWDLLLKESADMKCAMTVWSACWILNWIEIQSCW